MPRKFPRHVHPERDRHGKVRLYFRIGHGPRIPLPGLPGSHEFEAAYADALAGNVRRKSDIPGRERGTIAWGIASYIRSAEFQDLRGSGTVGYNARTGELSIDTDGDSTREVVADLGDDIRLGLDDVLIF